MKSKNTCEELRSQFHKDNFANFTLAIAGSFLSGLMGMGISWVTGELIDTAAGSGKWSVLNLALITGAMAAFFLFSAFIAHQYHTLSD